MNLHQWAIKWGISSEALEDFKTQTGLTCPEHNSRCGNQSEADIQSRIRLEATRKGGRVWRNNVGATYTSDGSFLRYGLANDSAKLNKSLKSSDLIGIKPVTITSDHIGCVIGQFIAREVKVKGWQYKGSQREQAQLNFLNLVLSLGGDAAFATSDETL